MVSYLVRLADHARREDPGFLIIMQNAEELIRFETLRDRLDGLAKEDLLYGGTDNSGQPNPPVMVRDSLNNLRVARKAGMSVFLISYVKEPDKVERIKELARREGFRLYFAERMLDRLNPPARRRRQPAPSLRIGVRKPLPMLSRLPKRCPDN